MTRTLNTIAVAALSVTLAAPLAYVQATQQAAAPKIAYINSVTIMERLPNRVEMEALIKKELAPFEAKAKAIDDSNQAAIKKYQADAPTMTAEAKAKRESEILEKQRSWRARQDTLNVKAGERTTEIQKPTMDALKKVIADIRQEDGYWMILDVSNENGLIVGIDKNMEITDRVMDRFKVALASLPKIGTPGSTGAPVNSGTGVGGVKIPPPPPGK